MKFRLITLTLTLLCASQAFANNLFIPNHYRNRRAMNAYSALGWSNRHEAGAQYSVENTDEETNGVKSGDEEETVLRPYIYYRTPVNLNIEAEILKTDNEDQALPVAGPKAETETMNYNLGLGYELDGTPIAFGVMIEQENTDRTSAAGTKTDAKDLGLSLGVGYRLEGDMYLGAGVTRSTQKATATEDDTDNLFALGLGKVYGDRANPTATSEAILSFTNEDNIQTWGIILQGLMNQSETLQFYGLVNYGKSNGPFNLMLIGAMAGADVKFADFYIGPQLIWSKIEAEPIPGLKREATELSPSIEAGYRIDIAEAFLRYDLDNAEIESSGIGTGKVENKGNTLTAGLAYKF